MARIKHTPNRKNKSVRRQPEKASPLSTPPTSRTGGRSSTTPARRQNTPGAAGQRRYKLGTVALWRIRRYQMERLIPPPEQFIRAVREVTFTISQEVTRWQAEALEWLQEATEVFLVNLLDDSMLCAIHEKHVTQRKKDFELAHRIRGIEHRW